MKFNCVWAPWNHQSNDNDNNNYGFMFIMQITFEYCSIVACSRLTNDRNPHLWISHPLNVGRHSVFIGILEINRRWGYKIWSILGWWTQITQSQCQIRNSWFVFLTEYWPFHFEQQICLKSNRFELKFRQFRAICRIQVESTICCCCCCCSSKFHMKSIVFSPLISMVAIKTTLCPTNTNTTTIVYYSLKLSE